MQEEAQEPRASSSQDDPIAKAVQQVTARAELAEEKNRQYEEHIKLLKAWLVDKNDTIAILKSQKSDLGEANQERKGAREIDLERIADRDKIIAKQDAEISRLRNPGFFASLIDKRTVYGAVGGYAACKVFSSDGNSNNPLNLNTVGGKFFSFSEFQTSADTKAQEALRKFSRN